MEPAAQSQLTARRRLIPGLRPLLTSLPALAAGLVLRLWMMQQYFEVKGDPLVYGDLAKNLLLHGSYALSSGNGDLSPTLIRLPGYPLFLALCFRLFGMENYAAAAYVQIGLELLGCLLLADVARRIAPTRLQSGAALCTLWLAALCPFTAVYAANPLTEGPTLFCIALALWSVALFRSQPAWTPALWFTFAVTFAALLRPDGALVGLALSPALLVGLSRTQISCAKRTSIAATCLLLALLPFAAWTARNELVFHVFSPLAPRYANDPGQTTYPGWQRWVKTWCLDFVSTYDVYWPVPGSPLDLSKLPTRAYDSPQQYAETAALAADYNDRDSATDIVPDVDERFGKLADERIQTHPLRYYLWLPLGRVADMMLRPRVENLNIDLDWWVYANHNAETRFSWGCVGLNAFYLLLGFAGLCLPSKTMRLWPYLLAYILLRCALLATIEAPETRYTLEFFPIFFATGGIALYWLMNSVLLLVLRVKASTGNG
jgi:hypothetical protein